VALNAQSIAFDARAGNHTRSALALVPPASWPVGRGVDGALAMTGNGDGAAVLAAGTAGPTTTPTAPSSSSSSSADDGWFVGIAISGGGLRSSNFAAACLFELDEIGLLAHTDYISAVSGGAVTAAYYCVATDRQWTRKNVRRQLAHEYLTEMLVTVVQPWHFGAMLTSPYDRGDVLAEKLDNHLFKRGGRSLTFADLRADRPRLLINTTDLQSGERFVFCDEHFDRINSNLAKYPLAFAVAASCADPIMLHAVTLRDHATRFEKYRHLIDGGLTDNLGVRTLAAAYEAQNEAAAAAGLPPPYPHGAVIVAIDARTHFNRNLTFDSDLSFLEMLDNGILQTGALLVNGASDATLGDLLVRTGPDDATLAETRQRMADFVKTGFVETQDRRRLPVRVAHLSLSRLAGLKNPPSRGFDVRVNDIPTSLNITDVNATRLYQAADLLMREQFADKLRALAEQIAARASPLETAVAPAPPIPTP
jgi:NTE family protein